MRTVQHKRATAAILAANNPTIAAGEIVVESDTNRIKIGDGSTAWAALPYQGVSLSSGTLPDARLSANVPLLPALTLAWSQPSTAVETASRYNMSALALASGQTWHAFFTPTFSLTVSQITMSSHTNAASGLTLARMGLFTYDETTATLVARTASDTTLFTATRTTYTRSFDTTGGFPSTYTLQAGVRYGIGLICVGTTAPQISCNLSLAEISNLTPRLSGVRNSQSDLSTGSLTTGQSGIPWARLS